MPELIHVNNRVPIAGVKSKGDTYRLLHDFAGSLPNSDALLTVNGQSRIFYGPLDEHGRETLTYTQVAVDGIGGGSRVPPKFDIPGASGNDDYDRGHGVPAVLGGAGNVQQNVAADMLGSNRGVVRILEEYTRDAVLGKLPEAHEPQTMNFLKIPLYEGDDPVPTEILIHIWGTKGLFLPPLYVKNTP